jgi:polyhydroxybutyrate depolymerase
MTCALALAPGCSDDAAAPGEGDAGGVVDPAQNAQDAGGAQGDGGAADASTGDGAKTPSCAGKTGASGDRAITITSGGRERTFDLHVPATYDPAKRTPLVFVFHGYTMDAKGIADATKFAAAADARGMLVAFPEGTSGGFNGGSCCGAAASNKVDDLGFARDMIAKVDAEYCVDDKRVFSTGFSNGGYFSYLLACEASGTFAAVASVAGVIGVDPSTCKPKRPVPLLHIHGTGDLVVPFNGGGIGASRSVATSVDTFKATNGCAAGDGAVVHDKDDVTCRSWAPCAGGSDVRLCSVSGGGHQWPGGAALPYGGSPSPNLDASAAIADFFVAHPMP